MCSFLNWNSQLSTVKQGAWIHKQTWYELNFPVTYPKCFVWFYVQLFKKLFYDSPPMLQKVLKSGTLLLPINIQSIYFTSTFRFFSQNSDINWNLWHPAELEKNSLERIWKSFIGNLHPVTIIDKIEHGRTSAHPPRECVKCSRKFDAQNSAWNRNKQCESSINHRMDVDGKNIVEERSIFSFSDLLSPTITVRSPMTNGLFHHPPSNGHESLVFSLGFSYYSRMLCVKKIQLFTNPSNILFIQWKVKNRVSSFYYYHYKLKIYFSILLFLHCVCSICFSRIARLRWDGWDEKSEKAVSSAWANQRQSRLSWRHFLPFHVVGSPHFICFNSPVLATTTAIRAPRMWILTQAQTMSRCSSWRKEKTVQRKVEMKWNFTRRAKEFDELELQGGNFSPIQSWLDSSSSLLCRVEN